MARRDDIMVLSSTLHVSKPGNHLHVASSDGIVHFVPFWLRDTFKHFIPHLTQCFGLAKNYSIVSHEAPVTCVVCLGWDGELPSTYAIAQERI